MPRRRYPSDLTNAQWAVLEPLVLAPGPGDRSTRHPGREIVDALLSVRWDGIP
jgi:transposase